MMKKLFTICILAAFAVMTASAQRQRNMRVRKNVPLDSIRLSDPAILADQQTKMYYMTGTGGMVWTSWVFDVYTQGVAYSESGTLDGPWTQQPEPITPPGYGHSMLFQRFDGQWVMSVHHHSKDARGRTVRIPHLFEVDLSGDQLKLIPNKIVHLQ